MPQYVGLVAPLMLAGLAVPAAAQVSIGPNGVRSGGTVIDARGVHTAGADVTGSGVRTGHGATTTISSNNGDRSVDCRGGVLSVEGNGNRLEVTHCRSVGVNGNGNTLAVRFDAPGRIAVMGNRNRVTWRAAPAVRVSVTNLGTHSEVTRAR